MKANSSKEGFVLLAVVIVLVVVSLILVRLASQSLNLTRIARTRADALQVTWARQSIERAVLPGAAQLFETRNLRRYVSGREFVLPRSMASEVRFGGLTLRLVLADEDAKLNINQLYLHASLAEVDAALKLAAPPFAMVQRLRPAVTHDRMRLALENGRDVPKAFASWGDIYRFDDLPLDARISSLSERAENMTCFGQMKLNYLRCDQRTLEQILKLVLSRRSAVQLSDRFYGDPRADIRAVMVGRGMSETQITAVLGLLTRVSTCFSLQTEIFPTQALPDSSVANLVSIAVRERPTSNNGDEEQTSSGPARWYRFKLR